MPGQERKFGVSIRLPVLESLAVVAATLENRRRLLFGLPALTTQNLNLTYWGNSGSDERGRPIKVASISPTKEGTLLFPGQQGGTNWYNPSYSRRTALVYIPA
jgi:hypothetical protein